MHDPLADPHSARETLGAGVMSGTGMVDFIWRSCRPTGCNRVYPGFRSSSSLTRCVHMGVFSVDAFRVG